MNYENPKLVLTTSEIEPGQVHWRSPANIAIVKYWGKHGQQLPRNPSLSFTLQNAFTETLIKYKARENQSKEAVVFNFIFEQQARPEFEPKLRTFFEQVLPIFPFLNQLELEIHSANSFPHSAGIASSASAMSALALCLCSIEHLFFHTLENDEAFDRKASYVARLGSGSACRSIYPIAALWGKTGQVDGSSDEYAIPMAKQLHPIFQNFHDDILLVHSGSKEVSSRTGHASMNQHPFAERRYEHAKQQLHFLLRALQQGDVETFGKIAEAEALQLHAMMMTSNPPYLLLHPNTLKIIEKVQHFRKNTKLPLFFSLDAGPNPHLLYPESEMHAIRPFIEKELVPLCEDGRWLADWVGEGPEEI